MTPHSNILTNPIIIPRLMRRLYNKQRTNEKRQKFRTFASALAPQSSNGKNPRGKFPRVFSTKSHQKTLPWRHTKIAFHNRQGYNKSHSPLAIRYDTHRRHRRPTKRRKINAVYTLNLRQTLNHFKHTRNHAGSDL